MRVDVLKIANTGIERERYGGVDRYEVQRRPVLYGIDPRPTTHVR